MGPVVLRAWFFAYWHWRWKYRNKDLQSSMKRWHRYGFLFVVAIAYRLIFGALFRYCTAFRQSFLVEVKSDVAWWVCFDIWRHWLWIESSDTFLLSFDCVSATLTCHLFWYGIRVVRVATLLINVSSECNDWLSMLCIRSWIAQLDTC